MNKISGLRSLGIFALLALGATAIGPAPAMAWGDEGHKVVALVAERFLTDAARQKVMDLLQADQDQLTPADLASRATWADRYRDSDRHTTQQRYMATRRWHFVDIELVEPDIDAACFGHPPVGPRASEGPPDDCVVDKIRQLREEVADAGTDQGERLAAFKFLLHFVGDVHQPLHAADNHDNGGNDVHVLHGTRTVSEPLHSYWDTYVVGTLGHDPQGIANGLVAKLGPQAAAWMSGGPDDWAWESFQLARDMAYRLGSHSVPDERGRLVYLLDDGYESRAGQIASEQLAKAGMRLAMLLNGSLH